MKKGIFTFLVSFNVFSISPGDKAIDFKLMSQNGVIVELNKLQKPIVLEWYNDGCPFVRKHYDSGNMQKTQEYFIEKTGGTWVSVASSNKGEQGYFPSSKIAKAQLLKEGSRANYLLLDSDGKVGQLYGAVTTPQIVIIGKENTIKYYGAIDSIASASKSDIKKAVNYVVEATKSIVTKSKVKLSKTKPYGCTVKY